MCKGDKISTEMMRLFGGTGTFSKGRTYSLRHDESVLALPLPDKGKDSTLPGGKRRLSFLRRTSSNSSAVTRPGPIIAKEGLVKQELLTTPMPDLPELDRKFMQMVDELGLSREVMLQLPPEKKWQLYLSKQQDQLTKTNILVEHVQPEVYIERLRQLTNNLKSAAAEVADNTHNLSVASDLKTALRTQPMSFVLRFIEQNGLESVLDLLHSMNPEVRQSQLHYTLLGCIKALMNNAEGRAHVLAHPTGITIIAQSLKTNNPKIKVLVLEILGAVCLVPGGHKKVLNAMVHFQHYAMERTRFQTLVLDLAQSLDSEHDSSNLQTAILSFINAIINYKAGEETLEFRMHLRQEFLMLGIAPVINRLHSLGNNNLNKHLDIFELVQMEDEKELAMQLGSVEIDSNNLQQMVDLLQRKTAHSVASSHLLSIVYHCLLLPVDDPLYPKYWLLIDRLVQQVVLQQEQGVDPDVSPFSIDVDNVVQQLVKEEEIKTLKWDLEEMQRTKTELIMKLRKKQWEWESCVMERDQHAAAVEKIKIKMNRKTNELTESWAREKALQAKISQLQDQLETALSQKNASSNSLQSAQMSASNPPPPPPPLLAPLPPPPPPPPPSSAGRLPAVPPPPPPSHAPSNVTGPVQPAPVGPPSFVTTRKKDIPKPTQPLKSLNWTKLHDGQVTQTVWSNIDDSKVFGILDLKEFEQTFSAFQRNEQNISPTATLRRRSQLAEKARELSVIDSRRAQNCNIILARLKMSNTEIRKAILSMDQGEKLGKDSLEQLKKFIPTPAEVELLESHARDTPISSFATADRFLLEMSRIPRYEQRLGTLYFKKTLDERLNFIRPSLDIVAEACRELKTSQKLCKVLELVLAFGNFMNSGMRGNAAGFRIGTLNKIADTKSSSDKDTTLLHYLIKTLDSKFRDALDLEVELSHVKKAAKIDLRELQKEIEELKAELQGLEEELEYHKENQTSSNPEDHFVQVMDEFAKKATTTFSDLNTLISNMMEEFKKTVAFFGEDPAQMSTDDFFTTFDTFLTSFSNARVEFENNCKKQAEEEKRKEDQQKQKELTLRRRTKRMSQALEGNASGRDSTYRDSGDFDKLISALRTADVFEDHPRKRTQVANPRKTFEFSRERGGNEAHLNEEDV